MANQKPLSEIEKATQTYSEIGNMPITQGYAPGYGSMSSAAQGMISRGYTPTWDPMRGVTTTGGGQTGGTARADTWRYGSPSDVRRPQGGGYVGGGYSAGYTGPMVPKPTYEAPEFQRPGQYKAPAYEPPERDEAVEKKLRQQYMAPGMSQIRRSTQQSILSSRAIDNPSARSMFIQRALEGVGAGVSQVAGTAGREASKEAAARYNTELKNYFNKWSALSDEAKTNYQNEWNTALMNYKQQVWGAQQEYGLQAKDYAQMPLAMRAGEYDGGAGGGGVAWKRLPGTMGKYLWNSTG